VLKKSLVCTNRARHPGSHGLIAYEARSGIATSPTINLQDCLGKLTPSGKRFFVRCSNSHAVRSLASRRCPASQYRSGYHRPIVQVLASRASANSKTLHDLSIAFATSADRCKPAVPTAPLCVRRRFHDRDLRTAGPEEHFDAARLNDLASACTRPRRILLLAGDLAAYLAGYLEYQTSLLGLPVFAAPHRSHWPLTRSLTKDDLVIAISFRRCLRQTGEGARKAREREAHCVRSQTLSCLPLLASHTNFSCEH